MKSSKSLFLFTSGLDDFIAGKGITGGLTVQMYFWSMVFAQNGWQIKSITSHKTNNHRNIEHINFEYLEHPRFIAPLLELYKIFCIVLPHPDLIIIRGATRSLFCLALFCRVFHVKLVSFMASDSDLDPGHELIKKCWDRFLFRLGLRLCKYVVCQNDNQYNLLKQNYGLDHHSIIIPNIFVPLKNVLHSPQNDSILWVANFRSLKRPEWFINLAKHYPEKKFIMIGGVISDRDCYEKAERDAKQLQNMQFLGGLSFIETHKYFQQAKVFICTSEVEGFPNTFLQAWSCGIPVITTFDPSGIVEKNKIGLVVKSEYELSNAMNAYYDNEQLYNEYITNVKNFFDLNYNCHKSYQKLIDFACSC